MPGFKGGNLRLDTTHKAAFCVKDKEGRADQFGPVRVCPQGVDDGLTIVLCLAQPQPFPGDCEQARAPLEVFQLQRLIPAERSGGDGVVGGEGEAAEPDGEQHRRGQEPPGGDARGPGHHELR